MTPKEGITKADDSDSDEDEDSNDDSRDSAAGTTDASLKEVAVGAGERAKGIPSRKVRVFSRFPPWLHSLFLPGFFTGPPSRWSGGLHGAGPGRGGSGGVRNLTGRAGSPYSDPIRKTRPDPRDAIRPTKALPYSFFARLCCPTVLMRFCFILLCPPFLPHSPFSAPFNYNDANSVIIVTEEHQS